MKTRYNTKSIRYNATIKIHIMSLCCVELYLSI